MSKVGVPEFGTEVRVIWNVALKDIKEDVVSSWRDVCSESDFRTGLAPLAILMDGLKMLQRSKNEQRIEIRLTERTTTMSRREEKWRPVRDLMA